MTDDLDLAGLLTIWPIVESFATHIPVGDLITLGRTSSSLRSSLHGRNPHDSRPRRLSLPRQGDVLNPEVGKHQTIDWIHLKAIALFMCSSVTHTRGQRTKPCVYCSKPICDACIVRDSFKNQNENTFKNRLRYFCRDCWSEGRPTRSFRYPAVSLDGGDSTLTYSRQNQVAEKPQLESNEFCECNLKDNGWLCLPCKEEQNSSSSAPSRLILSPESTARTSQCYGLDCDNVIDLDSPEKDRRRVCLWCQKPLRRQLGGEDRYAWNLKTIEARARNAESRSKDLEEYNRRRLKVLRMSRREMRGTSESGDDLPIFVRHLDTINYRNWINQNATPSPEAVWKSKNGYWRYHRGFLGAVQSRCLKVKFEAINGVAVADMARMTREGGLEHARLNRHMYVGYSGPAMMSLPALGHSERNKRCLNELRARVLDLHLVGGADINQIVEVLKHQYGLAVSEYEVSQQISKWWDSSKAQPAMGTADDIVVDVQITMPSRAEMSDNRDSDIDQPESLGLGSHASGEELQTEERALSMEDSSENGIPATGAAEEGESVNDDPPPYIP